MSAETVALGVKGGRTGTWCGTFTTTDQITATATGTQVYISEIVISASVVGATTDYASFAIENGAGTEILQLGVGAFSPTRITFPDGLLIDGLIVDCLTLNGTAEFDVCASFWMKRP